MDLSWTMLRVGTRKRAFILESDADRLETA
jgi:hypothetical protein